MNFHRATLIPINGNQPDVDFYIVTASDGGCYELGDTMHNRQSLVTDILAGQFEDIRQVWCGNPAMNSFQNVTEDIAREVWDARCDGWNVKGRLFDWVQANGGCSIHAEPVEW